jgi:hypothetical protein
MFPTTIFVFVVKKFAKSDHFFLFLSDLVNFFRVQIWKLLWDTDKLSKIALAHSYYKFCLIFSCRLEESRMRSSRSEKVKNVPDPTSKVNQNLGRSKKNPFLFFVNINFEICFRLFYDPNRVSTFFFY